MILPGFLTFLTMREIERGGRCRLAMNRRFRTTYNIVGIILSEEILKITHLVEVTLPLNSLGQVSIELRQNTQIGILTLRGCATHLSVILVADVNSHCSSIVFLLLACYDDLRLSGFTA